MWAADGFNVQLGTIGEWVGGLAGVAAIVFAWFAWKSEHQRALAAEARALKAEQRGELDAALGRARLFWLALGGGTHDSDRSSFRVQMHNDGNAPFFDVVLWGETDTGVRSKERKHPSVAPGAKASTRVEFETNVADTKARFLLATFADEDGRRWKRTKHGSIIPDD